MNKQLAAALAILGIIAVSLMNIKGDKLSEFENWKLNQGIKYESMFEDAYRERIFLENLAKIKLHNADPSRTYDMGLNQFSALTQ